MHAQAKFRHKQDAAQTRSALLNHGSHCLLMPMLHSLRISCPKSINQSIHQSSLCIIQQDKRTNMADEEQIRLARASENASSG
jgi:hypothetical protein